MIGKEVQIRRGAVRKVLIVFEEGETVLCSHSIRSHKFKQANKIFLDRCLQEACSQTVDLVVKVT